MAGTRVLLISRDDILSVMEADGGDRLLRLLATLTRQGYHLLATAPQPVTWTGQHGSPDDALLGPDSIRKRLSEVGGVLDGVYYIRRSVLTQKRYSLEALQDILQRYSTQAAHCILFSSQKSFVRRAAALGLQAALLGDATELEAALTELSQTV